MKKDWLALAKKLTAAEWAYVAELLNYEFDCNENKKAKAVLRKLDAWDKEGGYQC